MSITPKADIDEAMDEVRAQAIEFDYDENDEGVFRQRLERAQTRVAIAVRQKVGSANYAATGDTDEEITAAEQLLLVAEILRQRLVILTSRPEEAPPPEYIDIDALQNLIGDFASQANDMLAPYITEDTAVKGSAFAFGATGVDETDEDASAGDYDDTDFGSLPS